MLGQPPISPQRHRREAEKNKSLASKLVDDHPAWSVIVAFYAALHFLDEYAAFHGVRFHSHYERDTWLQSRTELGPMWKAYDCLYSRGRIARYDCPAPAHHINNPGYVRTKVFAWLDDVQSRIEAEEAAHGFGP